MTTNAPAGKQSAGDAPLMLSVSGLRGLVGRSFTPDMAATYGAAFASHLRAQHGGRPRVCVGRDSRPSGQAFASATMAGLAAAGCDVVDLGIVTTPSVAVMITEHDAVGGMVVTASHNPIEWNGLKTLNADGVAPPPDEAAAIIERFKQRNLDYVAPEDCGCITSDDRTHQLHIDRVFRAVDGGPIRAMGPKVVLDSVNGAGCVAGRMLLEQLGCEIVHLNGEPTGLFAHTPEPVRENLVDLAEQTKAAGAACGFAQDPDADRLAIIDEHGTYIGEEYTLVLASWAVLEMVGSGVMAANLSTSRMIDDLAARYDGSTVLRTAVGEANIVNALKPASGIVGGEGNGGVVFPPVCWVRDSLSSMALVLWLVATSGRTISQLVDDIPRYAMIKEKVDLADIGGNAAIPGILEAVASGFEGAVVNDADGVRLDFEDSWIHVRGSNTEPIMRLIAEAKTEAKTRALLDRASSFVSGRG